MVLRNEPITTRLMGIDEARASGARALFGEKYGDEVRVVSMGTVEGENGAVLPYSIELCGGTHARRTGDIGLVTLVAENAVSSGVRRLEALTGAAARRQLRGEAQILEQAAGLLKAPVTAVPERLASLIEERRRLERDLAEARKRLAMGGGASEGAAARQVGGVNFFARSVSGVEMKDLKGLADEAKAGLGSGVVAIVGVGPDGKAGVVVSVTKDLLDRFNAVELVRIGSEALGGKGRRRPTRHGTGRRAERRRGRSRTAGHRRGARTRRRLTPEGTPHGARSFLAQPRRFRGDTGACLGPGWLCGEFRRRVGSVSMNFGNLLHWALIFLVIALIAGVLGFGGLAGTAMSAAHLIFYVAIVLLVISLLFGLMRRGRV